MTQTFQKYLQFFCTQPWAALLLFCACTDSLIAAYIAEHFFDVLPCDLCTKQRIPFALTLLITVPIFAMGVTPKVARLLMVLAGAVLFYNSGLAFYHSGVELHWWAGSEGCGVNPMIFMDDPEAMRKALLNTPAVRCDEINFTFLGMTIANMNVPWSLGLACFAWLSAVYPFKKSV